MICASEQSSYQADVLSTTKKSDWINEKHHVYFVNKERESWNWKDTGIWAKANS